MNDQRRAELGRIVKELEFLKEELEHESNGEYEAFENLPDGLQDSDRCLKLQENGETLEEAITDFQNVLDLIEKAISKEE